MFDSSYLQNIYVKLIIIGHREYDRIEHSQLLEVVWSDVSKFYAGPVENRPDKQLG